MNKINSYVSRLKKSEKTSILLNKLIDNWLFMQQNDQATLVEAVEQLVVNSDVNGSTIQFLKESVEKLSSQIEHTKMHALTLVGNKLFCLYSR